MASPMPEPISAMAPRLPTSTHDLWIWQSMQTAAPEGSDWGLGAMSQMQPVTT
jgi:hypothetical protein